MRGPKAKGFPLPGSALPDGAGGVLEPLRLPMAQVLEVFRDQGLERILVVVSESRARDLVELRERVAQRWPDYVRRGEVPGELVVDTGKRLLRLRTAAFPRHPLESSWRPDVVVFDRNLPFAVVKAGTRAARRRCVPW